MEKTVKRESHDEAIVRLAKQARQIGVQLFRVTSSGEMFATSISRPGQLHRLTTISCDCVGFIRHQRCMHYAALLDARGWLPSVDSPATLPCDYCKGSGEQWLDGEYTPRSCWRCNGAGHVDVVRDRISPVADNVIPFERTEHPRPAA
jgi:hypothetical protein